MDFLFSGFIEFKSERGDPVHIDASKIIAIEQNAFDKNSCDIAVSGGYGTIKVPMSSAELRRKVSEIRARGQKTLRALLK
jgi:hypothetical protein